MNSLRSQLGIALQAPGLPDNPKVLVLWDADTLTKTWLEKHGVIVESGVGSHEVLALMNSGARWDIVIATQSMQRFYETTADVGVRRFSQWLRECSSICLLTPRKFLVDPARSSLGPWRLDEAFFEFRFITELDLASKEEVVLALSETALWDGQSWRPAGEFLDDRPLLPHKVDDVPSRKRRQHVCVDGTIFKIEIGSQEYFDYIEVIREAESIQTLSSREAEDLGVPKFLSLRRGKAVATLHRQAILGTPMLEVLENPGCARAELFEQVLDSAISYSQSGLFHNDFRPWNFLVTEQGLALIDYALLSRFDQDARQLPQVIALIGTLITVGNLKPNGHKLRMFEGFDEDLLEILRPIMASIGIELDSLYGNSWLALAAKRARILQSQRVGISDLVKVICSSS